MSEEIVKRKMSAKSLANLHPVKPGEKPPEAKNPKPKMNLQREARETVRKTVNVRNVIKAMETAALGTRMLKTTRAGEEVVYTAAPDTDAGKILLGYVYGTPQQSKASPGDDSPVQSIALIPPQRPLEVSLTVKVEQEKKK